MTHENPDRAIDTSHPYLVPRTSGEVEVWNIDTNDDGTPKYDELGWVEVKGQHEEEVDGIMMIPTKSAHPDAFSDEAQSYFAEKLASGQVHSHEVEGEQLATDEEIGHAALDALDIHEPMAMESQENSLEESDEAEEAENHTPSPELAELLEDGSWNTLSDTTSQLRTRTDMIVSQLDEFDNLLSTLQYNEGRTETSSMQLHQALESLHQIVSSGSIDEDLATQARSLQARTEEVTDKIRRDESSSDDDRYKAKNLEESAEEINVSSRVISGQFDELRDMMKPNHKFEANVEELVRTTQGYEYTIAMLKSEIRQASDDMMGVRARISAIEARIEDAKRLSRG